MQKRKILMIVCDGLGDRPVKELGGRTPLQYANKENFDWFASKGICGSMDPIAPGVRPGSDTTHLALFGYNPYEVYTGRGPFEAAGVGIQLRKGDVAFRCNFASVDEQLRVIDRRAGRIKVGTEELASSLNGMEIGGIKIIFKEGTEHRGALVLRGKGLSPKVCDVDPHESEARILQAKPLSPEAKKTAQVVNEFVKRAHKILRNHPVNKERVGRGELPANIVTPRGGGIYPNLLSMKEKYGMSCAGIAGVALIKGICRVVGMDVLEVKGATGGLDTDMVAKAVAALEALEKYDFVFLSVKAGDICSHDRKAKEKVRVVERLDEMLGHVRSGLSEDIILALTADHSTPISVGDHTGDPVPVTVFGEDVRTDSVKHFDEISVSSGGFGRIRGMELMPILLDLANRAEKFGA